MNIFFQQLRINLKIGKYFCAPSKTHFQECRLSEYQQPPPPMEISVDYGDGTHQTWFQDSPRNIWVHIYVLPGIYTIVVKGTVHLYTLQFGAVHKRRHPIK